MKTIARTGALGMLLMSFAALGACSGGERVDAAVDDTSAGVEPSAAGSEIVLARIEGSRGNVRWLAPMEEGAEPGIALLVTYPDRPLLDLGFLETHSALEAYLAVAPLDAEVPAALLARPGAASPELVAPPSVERRIALRKEHQARLDARPALDTTPSATARTAQAPSLVSDCDSGFKAAFKSEYGTGYGDDETCGDTTGFSESTFRTYYCDPGPNNDCSYPIAGLAGCYPAGDPSCSAFEGELAVHRARYVLGGGADLTYNMTGHRYRFAVANCEQSGNLTMNRQRGDGEWIATTIGPRQYAARVEGRAYPVATANPTSGVAYGHWKQTIPRSGSTYLMNRLTVSTGANQDAIVCGDVWREFETFDISAYGCNLNEEFCAPNTSCTGGCW